MEHCFDYLRQGIMCAGDMSLEGVIVSEEKEDGMQRRSGSRVVDGWGMKHECKSWVSLAFPSFPVFVCCCSFMTCADWLRIRMPSWNMFAITSMFDTHKYAFEDILSSSGQPENRSSYRETLFCCADVSYKSI